MPVPTHGPSCRTAFCYPSRCKDCWAEIFYWACTCGSTLLLDRLGDPWPVHKCAETRPLLPLRPVSSEDRTAGSDLGNPMLFFRCGMCGQLVRQGRLEEHARSVHGLSTRKRSRGNADRSLTMRQWAARLSATPATKVPAADESSVLCPQCDAEVLPKNLEKHLRKKCPRRER